MNHKSSHAPGFCRKILNIRKKNGSPFTMQAKTVFIKPKQKIGTIRVLTLDDKKPLKLYFVLKVKPETQNGTKVRLKGKGFPVYKEEGKFGDLIVTYNITIPTNLTEHQKELFRQLKNSIN